MATAKCPVHGSQPATMVCQHIVQGLTNKQRVGFWGTREDPGNPRPDAWCTACKEHVAKTSGEWIGDAVEQAKPQTLCGACYDAAKIFHMGGDPWS